MSAPFTPHEEARVLKIVTNAIATALRGSDERIRKAISAEFNLADRLAAVEVALSDSTTRSSLDDPMRITLDNLVQRVSAAEIALADLRNPSPLGGR